MLLENRLKENAKLTERALKSYYEKPPEDLFLIHEAQQYSLLGGGKRIRPTLVLEFCRMLGGSDEAALPFACAIEMIHTYSLIHDDLPCMDNDDYRRGKLTNHKKFGEATAVLAGDALLTKSFGVAAGNPYVSPETALLAVRLLSEAAGDGGMIGGQVLDMLAECDASKTAEEVIRLHRLKTGAIIRASALLGCLAAGKTPEDPAARAAADYASNIGLAFQVVDDVLDVTGDIATLGKSTGADQRENKVTFLNFYKVEEAKKYAATLTKKAKSAISRLPGHEVLDALADYLLERNH